MKKALCGVLAVAMVFSLSVNSFAAAPDRVLTADSQIWAGTGIPNPATTNVTEAGTGNNVDIDGYQMDVFNNQTATDVGGGLSLNAFSIGDITDSNTGPGADIVNIITASANDMTVNINSATIVGRFAVENRDADNAANTTTVAGTLQTNGDISVINWEATGTADHVILDVNGTFATTANVYVTALGGAEANAAIRMSGAAISSTLGFLLNDGTTAAGAYLQFDRADGAGAQTVTGTIDGTADGNGGIYVDTGTDGITFSNNVGNTNDLSAVTIRNTSGDTTFSGVVAANNVAINETIDSGSGTIAFNGLLTVNTGMTVAAGAYDVSIVGNGSSIAGDTTFNNTGTVTLGDAGGDTITFVGGLDTTAATNTNLAGTVNTTNTRMDIGDATLTSATVLDTGNNALAILNVGAVTGAFSLLLDSGATAGATIGLTSMTDLTGGLTIRDAGGLVTIGEVGTGTTGNITITNSQAGVTFSDAATASTVTLTNTTGTITFAGSATINTLATAAQGYNVALNGATNVITTDTNFINAGTVTFGNEATDITTFTGGLDTTGGPASTTVAGTLATTNTRMDLNATTLTTASSITSGGGIINIASIDNGGFLLTMDAGAGASAIAGVVTGAGGLTKNGAGTLTLGGANDFTGTMTINAGMVDLTGSLADTVAVVLADVASASLQLNGNETIGSLSGGGTTGGNLDLNGANTLTVGNATSTTYGGIISDGGGVGGLTKLGAGTLTLTGANTYTGTTTITAGTLAIGTGGDLGGGDVIHTSTFSIGLNTVNVGAYTQGGASTLLVSISGTTHGAILATGLCTVTATDTLTLNVSNYVPNAATYTIIDGALGGAIVAPIITITGGTQATFTATTIGDDLILTASRAGSGFASEATAGDSNAVAVGTVLDLITNPSADMTTVLNTMGGLSASQVASALDTLVPEVDAGVLNVSTSTLNNFIGVSLERMEDILRIVQNPSDRASSGFSAGDDEDMKLNALWAKGYGSYLNQDMRKGIQGYNAWNLGTALGADRLFSDIATVGISGGYAYGKVNSDANNGKTYINSAQGTLYAGYRNDEYPFYIDASGSFAWNWYNGKRDIAVGGINRTANAEYDGQQYSVYMGGGYDFNIYKKIRLTPLASLQWMHLNLQSYTETEAGALSLSVASQSYDILQSGLGASISGPIECSWGRLVPEVHGKWLYDFFGDTVVMTSTFNGGGASFNSDGFRPARNSFNIGGKLGIDLKNDVSVLLECDTELKDEFWAIYGAGTLRYRF